MRNAMLGLKRLTLACCPICGRVPPALQGAYRGHWARYVPCQCNMLHCTVITTLQLNFTNSQGANTKVFCLANATCSTVITTLQLNFTNSQSAKRKALCLANATCSTEITTLQLNSTNSQCAKRKALCNATCSTVQYTLHSNYLKQRIMHCNHYTANKFHKQYTELKGIVYQFMSLNKVYSDL